jgi:hypothetical protein
LKISALKLSNYVINSLELLREIFWSQGWDNKIINAQIKSKSTASATLQIELKWKNQINFYVFKLKL